MSTDLETYEGQVARLELEYVEETGRELYTALDGQRPVLLVYEPGNGTRYELVFTPAAALRAVPWSTPSSLCGVDLTDASWYLVSCPNTTVTWSYPFQFGYGAHHTAAYVQEHTGMNFADACAITALFDAACQKLLV